MNFGNISRLLTSVRHHLCGRILGLVCLVLLPAGARAGVYLTSYNFSESNLPQVYTDESLPAPYKLRVKFANGQHAVTAWNNNYETLESTPGPGTTTVTLYWLKYASDYSTLLEIGPYYTYNVTITPNSAPSSSLSESLGNVPLGGHVNLTSTITDPDNNLSNQAVDFSTDNANWTSGWNNWSGTTGWNTSGGSDTRSIRYTPPSLGTYYFRSRGQDTFGALSNFVYQSINVVSPSINFGSTPSLVASGATYTVQANSYNAGGFPYVTLYKGGAYLSGNWYGTQANTSDTQQANYTATFSDSVSGATGSASRSVYINSPPRNNVEFWAKDGSQRFGSTNVWNDPNDTGGALYNPGAWNPGDTITLRIVGRDNDGNASSVRLIARGPSGATIDDETRTAPTPDYNIYTGNQLGSDIPLPFNQGYGRYTYQLITTDTFGATANNTWYLDLAGAPVISQQPGRLTKNQGDSATFSVTASASPAPSYQWYFNGSVMSGANGSSLSLTNVQVSNAGNYYVVVSNSYGSVTSSTATLSVNVPPSITSQPQNQSALAGASVSFSAGASGIPTPSLQWQRKPVGSSTWSNLSNSAPYSGVNTGSLSISGVTTAMSGDQFQCVASNGIGSPTTSAIVTLSVTVPVSPPVVVSGTSATATTSTAFSYQINATNSPTSYSANGLPNGLTVSNSGLITGAPTVAGTFTVTIMASNQGGTGYGTLTLGVSFGATDMSVRTYLYDGAGQLKGETAGNYTLDAEGNPTKIGP